MQATPHHVAIGISKAQDADSNVTITLYSKTSPLPPFNIQSDAEFWRIWNPAHCAEFACLNKGIKVFFFCSPF